MKSKIIKTSLIVLSLAMVGGCADMKKMSSDIEAANAAAASAMTKANEAYALASKSQSTASDAASAAAKAQATADEALACCKANSDKIDRMFEKAMMK